jgi:outer membrane protein OmpA-like peptidoglycan-associated protein
MALVIISSCSNEDYIGVEQQTVYCNPDSGYSHDAGEAGPDAGEASSDSGVVEPDAGEVVPDAGNVTPDSGVVEPDSGIYTPDVYVDEDPQFTVEGGGCSSGGSASLLFSLLVGVLIINRKRLQIFGLLIPLFIIGNASAQTIDEQGTDIETERMTIPMDKFGLLNVESAAVRPQNVWGLNLALGYSNDSLVVREVNSGRVGSLVGDRVSGLLSGFRSFGRLQVGVALPLILEQGRDTGDVSTDNSVGSGGLGNLQASAKFNLYSRTSLKLAGLFRLEVPTNTTDYAGSSSMVTHLSLLGEVQHKSFRVLSEVGVRLEDSHDSVGNLWVDEEMLGKIALGYRIGDVEPAASFALATTLGDGAFEVRRRNYAEAMLGANLYVDKNWTLFAGGGRGLNEGYGSPDFRVFAGLRFEPASQTRRVIVQPPAPPVIPPPVVKPPDPVPPAPRVLIIDNTFFSFDSSKLTSAGREMLDKAIIDILSVGNGVSLRVVGHTDSIGSIKYNLRLGMKRAKSVEDYLVSHGLSGVKTTTSSSGESEPRATNKTAAGRAQNRRVEITVEGYSPVENRNSNPDGSTDDTFGDLK